METFEKIDFEKIEICDVLEILKKSKNYNLIKDLPLQFVYITDDSLQVGFLNKESNTFRIFYLKNKENSTNVVFSEEENQTLTNDSANELMIDNIDVSYQKVKKLLNEHLEKNFRKIRLLKIFYILQNDGNNTVWNISGLCTDFDILNVKICAKSGKILESSKEKMFYYNIEELKKQFKS